MRFSAQRPLTLLGSCQVLLGLFMLVPAFYAYVLGDINALLAFISSSLIAGLIGGLMLTAVIIPSKKNTQQYDLIFVLCFWFATPIISAFPALFLYPSIGIDGGLFEGFSALTTTAATIVPYGSENLVYDLWRSICGWLGGLITLVMALAIFYPLNLTGIDSSHNAPGMTLSDLEVTVAGTPNIGNLSLLHRLVASFKLIAPIYASLTVLILFILCFTDGVTVANLQFAMGAISTSGFESKFLPGYPGQAILCFGMLFGVIGAGAIRAVIHGNYRSILRDPETRLFIALVTSASLIFIIANNQDLSLSKIWGIIFHMFSFASTTGFGVDSFVAEWGVNKSDSLLIISAALVCIGGGVASTAGGVKLLRLIVLVRHSGIEISKLTSPNKILPTHFGNAVLSTKGVMLAWLIFTLFAASVLLFSAGLSLSGMPFFKAIFASTSALSNTGGLFEITNITTNSFDSTTPSMRYILCAAMLMGRIELLALIAVFNPEYWR